MAVSMAPWRIYSAGRLIASVRAEIYTETMIRALFPSAQIYADVRLVILRARPIVELDSRD